MKKTIAGLVLIAAAGSVVASPNYEEYGARVTACTNYADTAQLYWILAQRGQRPDPFNDKWMEPVRAHIEHEIYDNPPSTYTADSARLMGASYCMDHIQSLNRNHNAGQD